MPVALFQTFASVYSAWKLFFLTCTNNIFCRLSIKVASEIITRYWSNVGCCVGSCKYKQSSNESEHTPDVTSKAVWIQGASKHTPVTHTHTHNQEFLLTRPQWRQVWDAWSQSPELRMLFDCSYTPPAPLHTQPHHYVPDGDYWHKLCYLQTCVHLNMYAYIIIYPATFTWFQI